MRRLLLLGAVILVGFFSQTASVFASEVTLHLFWANGCPHCEEEQVFLDQIAGNYPTVAFERYEITTNRGNAELLRKVGEVLKADVRGVPFTVIGEEYLIGFRNAETTGKEIQAVLDAAVANPELYPDVVTPLKTGSMIVSPTLPLVSPSAPVTATKPEKSPTVDQDVLNEELDKKALVPESIALPILGELSVKDMSLPVFTTVVAAIDGFNPCAMWTLVFLISLLLGMEDRRRMWILGITFVVASAVVYFLFLSAWLNLFLFLGLLLWVRLAIGGVAIGAGIYNLREYLTNPESACKVTGHQDRKKVFERLKSVTQQKSFLLALFGIIVLAFAVNMVELVCSAGLPAVFTQVLTLSDLAQWQYYAYLLWYIFIFMLDDMIIFVVAMTTLQAAGFQSKYSRFSHLIGGVVMLIIGILLWLKPEWLMFG